MDALLGAENADPAVPAVTLDALRDLLAARDAEEKRRRRLWGCAGGAAFIVLAGLLAGVALQYERQISALNQNYAAIQSSYAAQQAELSAQISELQDAVRMGEATILDWRWLPVGKLHRDADKSWMPVQVQVTPRTTRDGVDGPAGRALRRRYAAVRNDRRPRRQLLRRTVSFLRWAAPMN